MTLWPKQPGTDEILILRSVLFSVCCVRASIAIKSIPLAGCVNSQKNDYYGSYWSSRKTCPTHPLIGWLWCLYSPWRAGATPLPVCPTGPCFRKILWWRKTNHFSNTVWIVSLITHMMFVNLKSNFPIKLQFVEKLMKCKTVKICHYEGYTANSHTGEVVSLNGHQNP